MQDLKFYLNPPTAAISRLGMHLFMVLSWLIIGGLALLVYQDTFFLVSFLLISLLWIGFVWWFMRQGKQKFFVALTSQGITVKTSHVSMLEFFWRDLSFIRFSDQTMTLRLKSSDEYNIGLAWLSPAERAEWQSAVTATAALYQIEVKV